MNAMPDASVPPAPDAADDLDRLVQSIAAVENLVEAWDEPQRMGAQALKSAIEDLHKEALRRMIRALKGDPAANARLREALSDPVVWGVLRFHGLVRDPLEARVRRALEDVRPFMESHGGGVELVAVKPPDTVELRLTGSCHGCPASSTTLTQGVEKAIREHCPEILHIHQVSRSAEAANASPARGEGGSVHYISPFALGAKGGWQDATTLDRIPERGILACEIKGRALLLSRHGDAVSCFDNRCAHLGMPLDMGEVADGVITCGYHGFRYLLETGECLTAPEVQLRTHAVRVIGRRVQVRIED